MYVYMATDPSNRVFHRRGEIENPNDAVGFANHMAKYNMWVYVGGDLGRVMAHENMLHLGMRRVFPTREPEVIIVQNPQPQFVKGNGASAPKRGFFARIFRR